MATGYVLLVLRVSDQQCENTPRVAKRHLGGVRRLHHLCQHRGRILLSGLRNEGLHLFQLEGRTGGFKRRLQTRQTNAVQRGSVPYPGQREGPKGIGIGNQTQSGHVSPPCDSGEYMWPHSTHRPRLSCSGAKESRSNSVFHGVYFRRCGIDADLFASRSDRFCGGHRRFLRRREQVRVDFPTGAYSRFFCFDCGGRAQHAIAANFLWGAARNFLYALQHVPDRTPRLLAAPNPRSGPEQLHKRDECGQAGNERHGHTDIGSGGRW